MTAGHDHTCRVWKVPEESQLIFRAHAPALDAVRYVTGTEWLSGGADGSLALWRRAALRPLTRGQDCLLCPMLGWSWRTWFELAGSTRAAIIKLHCNMHAYPWPLWVSVLCMDTQVGAWRICMPYIALAWSDGANKQPYASGLVDYPC